MARVFIGLGSNVGDRQAHLEQARAALAALPGTRLVAFSPVYETDPVGPVEQGPFLNAVAELATSQEPAVLRSALVAIETRAGREPVELRQRWGPRTLDLDLLLYDDQVIDTPELSVPHPRLHERVFVLRPLCDLAPEVVHPTLGVTMRELLERMEI